jgi:hypothetical protein
MMKFTVTTLDAEDTAPFRLGEKVQALDSDGMWREARVAKMEKHPTTKDVLNMIMHYAGFRGAMKARTVSVDSKNPRVVRKWVPPPVEEELPSKRNRRPSDMAQRLHRERHHKELSRRAIGDRADVRFGDGVTRMQVAINDPFKCYMTLVEPTTPREEHLRTPPWAHLLDLIQTPYDQIQIVNGVKPPQPKSRRVSNPTRLRVESNIVPTTIQSHIVPNPTRLQVEEPTTDIPNRVPNLASTEPPVISFATVLTNDVSTNNNTR